MQTNSTESIARRVCSLAGIATAIGISLLLLLSGGCSSQSAASGAAAAAAASSGTAVQSAVKANQPIVGRWVVQKHLSYADGTPVPDAVYVLVFNQDGSYETSGKAGYNPMVYLHGTYQAAGNALITHIGKATSRFTFRIHGSDLILVDSATKLTKTYHRG
jgi:hypothetical protein